MMDWFYKILCTTVGLVIAALIGGAAYDTFAVPQAVQANMEVSADSENYPSTAVDVTLVSLTDLTENVTPVEEENAKPAFDPLAGHSPDTHLAITRFCNAEAVNTSWSVDVDTARKYLSPDLDTEVLLLTYTTGDWVILTRGGDDYCYPIGAEFALDSELMSLDELIDIQP